MVAEGGMYSMLARVVSFEEVGNKVSIKLPPEVTPLVAPPPREAMAAMSLVNHNRGKLCNFLMRR